MRRDLGSVLITLYRLLICIQYNDRSFLSFADWINLLFLIRNLGIQMNLPLHGMALTLLGLGLIKINTVSANFNNPRPLLILNN